MVNQGKDHTKKTAQAIMTAKAGAFMGINSMRSTAYFMQAGNDISRSRVTESFYAFENFTRYALFTVISVGTDSFHNQFTLLSIFSEQNLK
jgi:hypothetical protein